MRTQNSVEQQVNFTLIRCIPLGASICYTQWLVCKGRTAVSAIKLCETPPYKIQWSGLPGSAICAFLRHIFSVRNRAVTPVLMFPCFVLFFSNLCISFFATDKHREAFVLFVEINSTNLLYFRSSSC